MIGKLFVAGLLLLVLCPLGRIAAQDRTNMEACIQANSGYASHPNTADVPEFPPLNGETRIVYFEPGCSGSCPTFEMTIKLSGIEWDGRKNVRVRGKRKAKIGERD